MALKVGNFHDIPVRLAATELAAGTSFECIAPINGYIDMLDLIVQVAIVTGGAVTVLTGDAGGTTVAGLTVTVADSATKGTRYSDRATDGSSTRYVTKGTRIQVVPAAAFNAGGALDGFLRVISSDPSPQP